MGANEKSGATWHSGDGPDAQPKPTPALGALDRHRDELAAEINDMLMTVLAAAGRLVTAEHDAQVLRDAADALSVRYSGMGPMIDTYALRARADRIAAGGES